ncbi:hypothetical protein [Elizabethkingia anophelis]|nr:hypothetical protein [Elizabethkingia anophelis]
MKRIIFIKPMTFHNLETRRITKKLHIDFLGFVFRIAYWIKMPV